MKVKDILQKRLGSSAREDFENARLEALLPIYQLGSRFLNADSEIELYERLLDVIEREFRPYTISIMMLEKTSGFLEIVASRGLTSEQLEASRLRPGERIAGWVFANNRPIVLNRTTQSRSEFAPLLTRQEIASSICFPMVSRDGVIGVINISQTDEEVTYSEADIELVSILSQLTVMAIENARLNRQRFDAVRMRTLLEQYVSPDVARVLVDQQHDLRQIGAIRDLTVMFADLRNFTLLVQQLDLKNLRLFLNEFFSLFTEEVYQSGGTLNKFMGDGVLVIFGAPVDHHRPAAAAVETSIRIIRRFQEMVRDYCREHDCFHEVALGIGVSSGELFIGNVGSQERFDYTVVGTAVNVAHRLASHATGNTLLLTDEVKRSVEKAVRIQLSRHLTLKGFQKAIPVHMVDLRMPSG
ncbi:MAG: GAF domain-containing protein [Desulfofustis sp.]|jgi:adenylate cyclase|nr:GAF domain-containing protein [Desulfofustis sp.]